MRNLPKRDERKGKKKRGERGLKKRSVGRMKNGKWEMGMRGKIGII